MNGSPVEVTPPAVRLRAHVDRYLCFSDPWAVDVALASVVANAARGDPLWLLLVSPPSSGKTELVQLFNQARTARGSPRSRRTPF